MRSRQLLRPSVWDCRARITDLLEAESLVNDGSGLVALKFTLAMVVTGVTPSVVVGTATLFYLVFGAVAVGLVAGIVVHRIQERIDMMRRSEITISLVTPYIAYLAAERLQCSGVLATLACGIYLGRRSSGLYSLHARIEASAVWRTLDFVLNGLVFLVLGLQLPSILADIKGVSRNSIILDGAIFSAIVILLRFLWIYPGEWISRRVQLMLGRRERKTSGGELFLVGWAGMRGVLALAAALSLPERTGQRGNISVPQCDYLSDVLRYFRDAGAAGIEHAGADSVAGPGVERGWL